MFHIQKINKDTKDNLKRFFNFRPLLLIFLTTIGTVYSVISCFLGRFIPIIIFSVFILTNLVIYIISLFKKDVLFGVFKIFGIKSAKICSLIVVCSALIFSAIATTSFAVNSHRDFENGNYSVSASVKEVVTIDGETKLLLGSVTIDGKSYHFNMQANADTDSFSVGDILTFDAYLYQAKLINNGSINTKILKTKVHYYCVINDETLIKSSGSANFIDNLKDKTKTILYDNMTDENAGLSYAVLCGDKSLLTDEYVSIFKSSGLAHVLAVSGMHIAFLVGVVLFILKLCKIKKKYQFFIVLGVLLFYNILCNFAPSVFRASVMSLCLMLGMIFGERNDMLSNLSLAGIIVLTFQSLFLFDVGFLLSFGSVFGIFLLSKPIEKLLLKVKFPKFLASSISVILGATVGSMPWVCKYFKYFAPISILSNLIVVPLFSIMYVVLLISVAINLIVSAPFLIIVSQFFVNIVVSWSSVFTKFGVIQTLDFDIISAMILYLICWILSPYFIMEFKSKLICALSFCILLTSTLSFCNAQRIINHNSIFYAENTSKTLFLTTKSGKTMLCNVENEDYYTKYIDSILSNNRIKNIDYLCLFNYNDSYQKNVCEIVNKYNIKKAYLFGSYDASTIYGLNISLYSSNVLEVIETLNYSFESGEIEIDLFMDSSVRAVSYKINDLNILHILSSVSSAQIASNDIFARDYKVVCVQTLYDRYKQINSQNYICTKAYKNTDLTYILQDDEVYIKNIS